MGIEIEEKKLTDEEWFEEVFVKTVGLMEKFCKNRKELSKDIDIVGLTDNEEESVKFNRRVLNYVRSLQAEIERLANVNMQTIGKNAELLLQVDELKDENIEQRDIHYKNLCGYKKRIAELEEKIDELRERNAQLSEMADYDKGHKEGYEHGEKTTAKEILQGFNKWLNQAIKESYNQSVNGVVFQGGKNRAFHEVKDLVKKVAESKGVEVE